MSDREDEPEPELDELDRWVFDGTGQCEQCGRSAMLTCENGKDLVCETCAAPEDTPR